MLFRQLNPSELESGYRIICDNSNWLNEKGINQWPKPIPKEIYQEWHEKKENFGLFQKGNLLVVLSLVLQESKQWEYFISIGETYWLCSIASALEFKGNNYGQIAVHYACDYLKKNGIQEVYLDCLYGSGFLPNFYKKLGFKQLERKNIEYPVGTYDMVLMYKFMDI